MSFRTLFSTILLLVAAFQIVNAQTSASKTDTSTTIAGKWIGFFEGDSSGKFELIVNRENQKLTGQVIMLTDDGSRQSINLKTLVWQNGQLKASYTDPSEGDEVSFTGSYINPTLKGTWQSDGGQSTGSWQASRAAR